MTTLADALGPASRPLSRVVAVWTKSPPWRRCVLRRLWPWLGQALDELAAGIENLVGPL